MMTGRDEVSFTLGNVNKHHPRVDRIRQDDLSVGIFASRRGQLCVSVCVDLKAQVSRLQGSPREGESNSGEIR